MMILCHAISMLFKNPYNTPLINLDRLVITGKYHTSVFYVRSYYFFNSKKNSYLKELLRL